MEGFEYRNPYAAPTAQVQPAVAPHHDDELVKAGRLPRLMAQLANALFLLIAMVPMFIGAMISGWNNTGSTIFGLTALVSVLAALALLVVNLVLLNREGQSLGKRWIGIRIVRSDGDRVSLGRLIGLRYFVPGLINSIPYLGAVFALANPLWIFGEERRCLHDLIADTIVVNA